MNKIIQTYSDQVFTTLETMRRRGLLYYDQTIKTVYRLNHIQEFGEDLRDLAINNKLIKKLATDIVKKTPLESDKKVVRNSIQEFYFGITVLMIAMCCGQLTGVLCSISLMSDYFDPLFELLVIGLLPIYAYFHLKNKIIHDDIQRRGWMFIVVFLISLLTGDLFGVRLISTVPSLYFLPPLILALLIDIELLPSNFYEERQRLLSIVFGVSFVNMLAISIFIGMNGFFSTLIFFAECLILIAHFQIMVANFSEEYLDLNMAQLLFVASVAMVQLPLSLFAY